MLRVYLNRVFSFMPANRRMQTSGFAVDGSVLSLVLNTHWQIKLEAFSESDGDLELVTGFSGGCTQGSGSLAKTS